MTSTGNQNYSPFYFLPSKEFALLWHPKCACTSASTWIASQVEGLEDSKFPQRPRVFLDREGYLFDNLDNLVRLCKDGSIKNLAVISRDPLSRMLSSYVSKFVIRTMSDHQVVIPEVKKYEAFASRFANDCSDSKIFLHGMKPSIVDLPRQEILVGTPSKRRRLGEAKAQRGDVRGLSLAYFLFFINHPKTNALGLNPHFRPQIACKHQFDKINLIKEVVESFSVIRVESFDDDLIRASDQYGLMALKVSGNKTRYPDGWLQSDNKDTVLMPSEELVKKKLVPTRTALIEYLIAQSDQDCMPAFKYDYMLFDYALPEGLVAAWSK